MGKPGDIIKKYVIKPITEHIISSIIVFVSIALAGVWMAFKAWFATEYTFKLAAGAWLLIFAATAGLPVLIAHAIAVKRKARGNAHLLTDKMDIIMAFTKWLCARGDSAGAIIIRYDQVDQECNLPPGTTKRYAPKFDGIKYNDEIFINVTTGEKTFTIAFIRGEISEP